MLRLAQLVQVRRLQLQAMLRPQAAQLLLVLVLVVQPPPLGLQVPLLLEQRQELPPPLLQRALLRYYC